jgi:Sulfotransferase family
MTDAPIFILGSASSGTTLLSVILDRHPRIACGPEMYVLNKPQVYGDYSNFRANVGRWLDEGLVGDGEIDTPEFFFNLDAYFLDRPRLVELVNACTDLREFLDRFYAQYMAKRGKARWVDKSGSNAYYLDRILTLYPAARIVHLVRDGRDVMCSILGRDPGMHCHAAAHWLYNNAAAYRYREQPGYLSVRYEDLATEPEPVVRRVCDHIGEAFVPAMLAPVGDDYWRRLAGTNTHASWQATPIGSTVNAGSVGRYRTDLPRDVESLFWHTRLTRTGQRRLGVQIDGVAELMSMLGYAEGPPSELPAVRLRWYAEATQAYARRARTHWRRERRVWRPLTFVSPWLPRCTAKSVSPRVFRPVADPTRRAA